MQSLVFDLRYSARDLRRRPGITLTAIVSLALGIGATSAVFSVIYAVLFNPYPYTGADRIMEIHLLDNQGNDRFTGYSGPEIDQLRQLKSFESVVAMQGWNLTTTDGDLPEDVRTLSISPESPNHWGVPALMGRWLIPSDAPPGGEPQPIAVVSYQFWQRYFAGDPGVIGRAIRLVHKPYQIVGVMPPRFKWGGNDLYRAAKVTQDPNTGYAVSLKLHKDVTVAQANAELEPVVQAMARVRPAYFPVRFRVNLQSIVDLYARPLGNTLYVLLGAVASLLLIGCGNVSILLLARGIERQHEFAVRSAVGANRARILRQLLTESFVIAAAGSAIGLLVAWRGLALIVAFLPEYSFPPESVIRINIPVVLFSIGLAFATTILSGLWPALQISRPDLAQLLQNGVRRIAGGARARRTHSVMVGAQVALTVLLLTLASTAAKGFLRMLNTTLGYDPQNAVSLGIPVHDNSHVSWKDRVEYFDQLRAAVAAMPQVVSAAVSSNATPPLNGNDCRIEFLGRAELGTIEIRTNFISSEYFSLLHIPLVQGRVWDHPETMRAATVAVINQSMARQYWPNGDAIGQQIRTADLIDEPPYSPSAPGSTGWLQIVGIVADARDDGMRSPIKPAIYVPYSLRTWMFTQILAKTRVSPLAALQDMRTQIARIDPDQQITTPRDLHALIKTEPEYAQQRLVAALFSIFSLLALTLAAVGLYSVVSYSVATRTNEFGIRMALGARSADILSIVLSSTGINVGSGLLAGVLLSVIFGKFATKWVNESSRDPLLLGGVTLLLVTAALVACIVPARRAASTDPLVALRYE
ncbi:MAG TPA: ABC transporter permease [Candidatus Saccharimonadales bacterium]|nr:ABC transporter permease [Candidatus Saccharimonadales bacterium]